MIAEAKRLLDTSQELSEGRTQRALELLGDPVALADFLIAQEPATVLGKKGDKATANKGPQYFRKIAGMRKTGAGGRPGKNKSSFD
jgi:hypothetical protein